MNKNLESISMPTIQVSIKKWGGGIMESTDEFFQDREFAKRWKMNVRDFSISEKWEKKFVEIIGLV